MDQRLNLEALFFMLWGIEAVASNFGKNEFDSDTSEEIKRVTMNCGFTSNQADQINEIWFETVQSGGTQNDFIIQINNAYYFWKHHG